MREAATAFGRRAADKAVGAVRALRFGKPTGLTTIAELAAATPSQWQLAVAAPSQPHRTAKQYGAQAIDFESMLEPVPDLGVLTLCNASVLAPQGWVFTDTGRFVSDASWWGRHARRDQLPRSFGRSHRLGGVCLTLATDFASVNYCHYVMDGLARIGLLQRAGAGCQWNAFDHVLLPRPLSDAAAGLVSALGVPADKCRWLDEHPQFTADTLIVTSFPGVRRHTPDWVPAFLQSVRPNGPRGHRRIFLPRDGTRRIVNEAELIDISRRYGVEVFDHRRDIDVARYFGDATLVAGPHGAAMTNLAFCRPGTKVLELFSADHLHPHFYTVANAAGLDYGYLVGPSLGTRPAGAWGPSPYDYTIDPAVFEDALRRSVD